MLRFLGTLVVALLLIAIIVGSILWWKQTAITGHFLSKSLGTTVCLDKPKFGFSKTTITNLTIDNPNHEETEVPSLFSAGKIEVELSAFALLEHDITIPQIKIDNCILGVVLYNKVGSDNSWSRMMAKEPSASDSASSSEGRQVKVNKLIINNLYLNLYSAVDQKQIQIPVFSHIEIDDIGDDASVPLEVIGQIVLAQVIDYVLNNVDVGELLIKAVGGQGKPAVEIPALIIDKAIKKALKKPKQSGEMPVIPRGSHCYSP